MDKSVYLVLLDFPKAKVKDPNIKWMESYRQEIEQFCKEYSYKIGTFYILPEPYFPVLDRFLREATKCYRKKGYRPLFRILKAIFPEMEYNGLRKIILDRVFEKLEKSLKDLDESNIPSVVQKASKDLDKANEAVLLFQLDKYFPKRMDRFYDLINILNEKIVEHEAPPLGPVLVTEI